MRTDRQAPIPGPTGLEPAGPSGLTAAAVGGAQRWRPVMPLAVPLAMLPSAAYLANHNPIEGGFYPRCPFHGLTGLWCPGCGLTRASYKLVHGDVIGALGSNVLLPVALAAAVVGWWCWWRSARRRPMPAWLRRVPTGAWRALVAGVFLFGVLRNLPGLGALAP